MTPKNLVTLPDGLLEEEVTIVVIQINFGLELLGDPPIYRHQNIDELQEKFFFILNYLKNLGSKPNVIVFPEYSIPPKLISDLEKFAEDNSFLIIAGSHHDPKTLESRCPVIIPGMKTIFFGKKYLSEIEEYVKPSKYAGGEIHWKFKTKEYCIQIFLCSDYLDTALTRELYVDSDRTGIIIVPMNSDSVRDFYNLANIHLTDKKGKFVILCNSCGTIIDQRFTSVGQSAIFGNYRNAEPYKPHNKAFGTDEYYVSSLQDLEGFFVYSLNLSKPKVIEEKRKSFSDELRKPTMRKIAEKVLRTRTKTIKKYEL